MTIDSPDDEAIESANITSAVDVGYNQPADLGMNMLIGRAIVERERALRGRRVAASRLGGRLLAQSAV